MSPYLESPMLPTEILMMAESQWIFTESELSRTPSILDGLSPEKETENRGKGTNFIIQVGMMLKIPQVTLATASVLLHRFFMRQSMVETAGRAAYHYYPMAATSIYLATKIEEDCRKMKDLVVACVRVAQKDPHKVVDEQDKEYWRWRDNILHNEDILLEALCFDLTIELPYKFLFEYLNYFGEGGNRRLRNSAWAFINDSCMTMLCLQFPSRVIAASALYAAAKHCRTDIADENGRPWWEIVGVELKAIKRACNYLAAVYEKVHVKNGRDVSIHQRTPEDDDESNAKTRAASRWSPRTAGHEQADTTDSPAVGRSNGTGSPKERARSSSGSHQRIIAESHTADGHDGSAAEHMHGSTNGDGDENLGTEHRRNVASRAAAVNEVEVTTHPPNESKAARESNGYATDDMSEEGE
ncbi:MAG: hypothetical protein Q9218_002477, partial [Villophora microphyllina]